VAEMANVSISTVSRVLNGTAPVAAETVTRVLEAVSRLNYRPSQAAQILAGRKTRTIGLALPEISGSFFMPMLRGIELGVQERGYDLLVHASSGLLDRRSLAELGTSGRPHPLGEHNTDGLLVFTDSLDETELARLHHNGFPLVLLHRSSPAGLDIPCVTVENKDGARKLVDHLIAAHGLKRIAFLAGPDGDEDSHWREVGYREALAANGVPFDPALIALGAFNGEQAGNTVAAWIADRRNGGERLPEAIFSADDDSAAGVITTLNNAGFRVPQDIAVVGFDDAAFSRYLTPPLTTVRAPIERAGREAAHQLIRQIDGEPVEPLILLPTELIIRGSCGCDHP
jgi:LacI family transcriptional regulator